MAVWLVLTELVALLVGLFHPVSPRHPSPSSSPLSQAAHWDIQIASFRQRGNAVRLVNDLKQQGYASFMRPKIASSENPLTKVFIGPLATKSQVDQMLTALLQTNGLRGIAIYQKQGDS